MAKGSSYEREVAKRLGAWWAGDDNIFWRTSNSGGRGTVRAKAGKTTTANQHGDIGFIDPIGKRLLDCFTIEIKRGYKDANVHDLLDRTENSKQLTFEKFLQQTMDSATNAKTPAWLLITKRDRKSEIIWMPHVVFRQIRLWGGLRNCQRSLTINATYRRTKKKKAKRGGKTYNKTITAGESKPIIVVGVQSCG